MPMAEEVTTGPALDRLDPWIEPEGNIVLVAQGKYFRVHRSVLSTYSDIFKDMFNCPLPQGGEQELIENCPVVHLHDTATDLQIVLKAMYDRSFPVPHCKKVPLSIVAAFARLGKKYIIHQLLDEAKERLRCANESTLGVAARIQTVLLFPSVTESDPYNFQIMNLLEELDLQASLPLTMYQCIITCPVTYILDGYKHKDTTHTLSRANMRSAFLLKDIVENLRSRVTRNLRPSTVCFQGTCASNLLHLFSDGLLVKHPFFLWVHDWEKESCKTCRQGLKVECINAIQEAWNKFPTAFGFDSWAEIAKRSQPSLSDGWYSIAQRSK